MISQTCSACGCTIGEAALRSTQVVRRGTRVYCAECAKLIMAPDELLFAAGRTGRQPQPPPRPAAGGPPSPGPKVISAVRFSRGGEIVDKVRISAQGRAPAAPPASPAPPPPPPPPAPSEQAKDDDWLKDPLQDDDFADLNE
ncbi:MAG: hypothetical protein NTW87_34380, partial [Planctomycetota bacterium]|nr:hypothetical protein [Planctomycetota bacterium]